ncbi:zinc-dependent peptidase [Pseudomonas neustonica]|uniref:Zinc-dependent peptidase n=1 Tax=Pseudomonas neustonica TaxID=2487346 RepID=A0ABX9XKX6_9PSED|nr:MULTISPECIES: M90 family metallopeptidase [Pseudomonas]MBA6419790.1 zinc-dependent peptidase [Pseudomonas sp. 5Ae-yellow]ROZ83034.1 zinc-dependent peptidase [Pseudomonas sp. SSM44]ROZ84868.1 zinc-dependent peptidase [Pseudomonas neustonica]|tara:strand:- start:6535 stop:7314 length:780 start_codon:yes stop_codon:yes gene_type:complete
MSLFKRFAEWREDRQLAEMNISPELWQQALGDWAVYQGLSDARRAKLQDLALRLLLRKDLHAAGDAEASDELCLRIAGMAVVPVLELGLDWYDRWHTLILYDGPFRAEHSWRDEAGVVHEGERALSGQAWLRGPVVLSLADVQLSGQRDGYNVVIHELAHTLDMRHDGANGAPPLHHGMSPAAWKRDMTAAWDDLGHRAAAGQPLPIDAYALEAPAEFFAVLSETFFERPALLRHTWPEVYQHLADFYRQDPLDNGRQA